MTAHTFEQLTFTQAVHGFQLAARARQLSEHTIKDYMTTYRKFADFLADDPPFAAITRKKIKEFLASQTSIGQKTLLNYHTGLSALYNWAVKEQVIDENLLHSIDRPRPKKKPIVPYLEDEIRSMLSSLSQSREYERPGKRVSTHSLKNQERNRAILLLLLDTGIREQECCSLRLKDVDERNSRITVTGKGQKTRIIPYSSRTGQALWRYQIVRKRLDPAYDNFFLSDIGEPMSPNALLLTIRRIGARAKIKKANVHRFRHTFAINYLRNGGDPWTLQLLLGHATMDMVKTYLQLAQVDLDAAHKKASPVSNWKL